MSDAGFTTSSDILLHTEKITKWFPVTGGLFKRVKGYVRAVDGVDIQIPRGKVTGLVGESGCGKSTFGRIVIGLLKPTSGKVYFEGKEIFSLEGEAAKSFRRSTQIVFQDPESSLNPRLTVGSILKEARRVSGGESSDAAIGELLVRVGLEPDHQYRYPRALSGGQKQRVGIARAIAVNPKFIVLDEPVSSLDVSVRAQIVNLLLDLQKELGLTYLFILHDLSLVKFISDYIAVMYLGKIVELAPSKELFEKPSHPYTIALLSSVPRLEPESLSERVILKGDVPSPVDIPRGCRFHTRCPNEMDRCKMEEPKPIKVGPDHYVCCHLLD